MRYAQENVHPQLKPEHDAKIEAFYSELREEYAENGVGADVQLRDVRSVVVFLSICVALWIFSHLLSHDRNESPMWNRNSRCGAPCQTREWN